ncbi:TPA: hypothetical protein ACH3X3_011389 [Trebouxia sp. C0006]
MLTILQQITFSGRKIRRGPCATASSVLFEHTCTRRTVLRSILHAVVVAAAPVQVEHNIDRVFAVSDVHCDYTLNQDWLTELKQNQYGQNDVLLLAGDISDDLGLIRQSLSTAAEAFGRVFYVPGNHELWVRGEPQSVKNGTAQDSFQKLQLILQLCQELGIHTTPARLGNLCIVPLLSWHHSSWDKEPDIQGVPHVSALSIADYGACIWPDTGPGQGVHGSLEIAEWFDKQNKTGWQELLQQRQGCDVISLAHFLPHQALLPEKRYLFYPNLAKAAGSEPLAHRLRALQPDVNIFGHTHFSWDATIEGIRHIQAPLCGPSERRRRPRSLTFEQLTPLGPMDRSSTIPNPPGFDPVKADWLPIQIYESDAYKSRMGKAGDAADRWQALQHGYMCPPLGAHWSEYYSHHMREPDNVQMAPWVAGMYERRTRRAAKAAGKPPPNKGM